MTLSASPTACRHAQLLDTVPACGANYSELMRGLPVREQEAVQLARGTAELRAVQVVGRDIVLVEGRTGPRYAVHTVLEKDWLALLAPLSLKREFRFNGMEAQPRNVFLSNSPDGFATLGEERHNITVGIAVLPFRVSKPKNRWLNLQSGPSARFTILVSKKRFQG